MRLVQVYDYQDITSICDVHVRKLESTFEKMLHGNRSSPYRQVLASINTVMKLIL